MSVSMDITQGMWSETGLESGFTMVLGYDVVQLVEVKNQSNCSSRGSSCMLLQVKDLPFRGSSIRPCVRMKSLKVIISLMFPPGLFRLVGLRM